MAMLPADIFTHAQAVEMRRSGQIMGNKKAHAFLSQLRKSLTEAQPVDRVRGCTEETVNLTDCA
eukprot:8587679-Lingulodinium_polyedra.AAC.1